MQDYISLKLTSFRNGITSDPPPKTRIAGKAPEFKLPDAAKAYQNLDIGNTRYILYKVIIVGIIAVSAFVIEEYFIGWFRNNAGFWSSASKKIHYTPEELASREKAIPNWFDAFYSNTNEKEAIQKFLDKLLKLLNKYHVHVDVDESPILLGYCANKTYIENLKVVLDIGCCSGNLHLRIAESFVKALPDGQEIDYVGIDKNTKGINKIKEAFASNKQNYDKIKSTIFDEDFFHEPLEVDYLDNIIAQVNGPKKADFVIVSHVAYYAPNMQAFIKAILNIISSNGFVVFIHESETSLAKVFAKKYNTPVNTKADMQIREILTKEGAKFYLKQLYSEVMLPVGISKFIDYWLNQDKISITHEIETCKYLLEFIFQMPFEILKQKGLEDQFIADLKLIAKVDDNKIIIKSNLELVTLSSFYMFDVDKELYDFYEPNEPHLIQDNYYRLLSENIELNI